MPSAAEREIREIMREALTGLRGVGNDTVARLVDSYAPRFAELASLPPAEAQQVYEALLVNLDLDRNILKVDAQTAGLRTVYRVMRTLAGVARAFVLPGVPAAPVK